MIQLYKRLSKHLTRFIPAWQLILTRLTPTTKHSHKQSRISLIKLMLSSMIRKRLRSNQRCNKTSKLERLRTMNMLFLRSITICSFNNLSNNSKSTPILLALVAMVDTIRDVKLTILSHQVILRVSFITVSLVVLTTVNYAMQLMDILIQWRRLNLKKSRSSRSTPITTVNGNVTLMHSMVANTEIARALTPLMMSHIAADNAILIYVASVSKPTKLDDKFI